MCNTTEEKVLRKKIGIGNEVLYKLCKEINILDINNKKYTDGLAAQMWLIGRSYAASPERRGYGVLKGTKIEYKNSGNGLDDYFDTLAKELIDNYNSVAPSAFWSSLKNEEYSKAYNLDTSSKDLEKLKNNILAVLLFNRLLKEIRFNIDIKYLRDHIDKYLTSYQKNYGNIDEDGILEILKNNSRNMISFCSKFLHFHFPDTVFIIDSITKSHFKVKGQKYLFKFNNSESVIEVLKSEEKTLKTNFLSEFENEGLTDPEKEYVTHCIREYLLAKAINENCNDVFKDKHIPRVVDTYMLIANS